MTFSGNVYRTRSTGTMKFLYHDLDIEIELKGKSKMEKFSASIWRQYNFPSANPASATMPPRIVKFQVERNMNKSFVNLAIKSLLAGLKETMIMSRKTRKPFVQKKKSQKRC